MRTRISPEVPFSASWIAATRRSWATLGAKREALMGLPAASRAAGPKAAVPAAKPAATAPAAREEDGDEAAEAAPAAALVHGRPAPKRGDHDDKDQADEEEPERR